MMKKVIAAVLTCILLFPMACQASEEYAPGLGMTMEKFMEKYNAKNGAAGIVMNVNTGAILGMASYPSYDLNNYSMVFSDELAATL